MNEKLIFERYFNGEKNFITPYVFGYKSVKCDDEIVVFELSEGEGLYEEHIVGCTSLLFDPQTKEICRIELSQAFSTRAEARNYVKNLSADEIRAAKRKGEVKKLGVI